MYNYGNDLLNLAMSYTGNMHDIFYRILSKSEISIQIRYILLCIATEMCCKPKTCYQQQSYMSCVSNSVRVDQPQIGHRKTRHL